jgi:hypothetical protein
MSHSLSSGSQPSIFDLELELVGDQLDELVLEALTLLVGERHVHWIGADAKQAFGRRSLSAHRGASCEESKRQRCQPAGGRSDPQSCLCHVVTSAQGGQHSIGLGGRCQQLAAALAESCSKSGL